LLAYTILHAMDLCERGLIMLSHVPADTPDLKKHLRHGMGDCYSLLVPLDDVEQLARRVLAGLGLPQTINEFSDYEGNRYHIDIDVDSCSLASEPEFETLRAVVKRVER
jgi:hypothetical protein